MSRWIDADALNIYDVSPVDGFVVMGVTEEDVELAPSIDIVRCKECKYYNGNDEYCSVDHYATENGFCFYGEIEGK